MADRPTSPYLKGRGNAKKQMQIKKQKIKKIQKALGIIFVISFVFGGVMLVPLVSFGASDDPTSSDFQLVPACESSTGECGWSDLLALISNIMKFLIYISVSIGVLACAYAGFLYITAFGESGKIEQAHKIFSSAITGFLIILLAWLVVATLLKVLDLSSEEFSILDYSGVQTLTTK
jgi:membrane-associated protease RseP (regulator of RpoE activity)